MFLVVKNNNRKIYLWLVQVTPFNLCIGLTVSSDHGKLIPASQITWFNLCYS